MLHDRGDRLRDLGDRTEQMSNDAASFADLARQLAKKQSKWPF
jgi:hypothetical protein